MYPLVSKAVLCGLFGFSRQAWYDNKKRQSGLQMQEVFILTLAKQLRKEHKRMGAEDRQEGVTEEEKGFVYLSLVTDAYSKKIVGWCLWPDLTSEGALNALRMAVAGEGVKPGLIHHSDRGIQYCCNDYVNFLKGSKIDISMTQNGDPYENAIAERVNGILKDEYDLNETFADYYAALEATKLAVHKYNNKRPHRSVDFMFPKDAHQQQGLLKKHWKKRKYRVSEETGNRLNPVPVKRE